jgi:hypothetical protein
MASRGVGGTNGRPSARDRTADGKTPGNDFVRRAIERRFLSALSASHFDMVGPHGIRLHDAIEAVKPLSPAESKSGDLVVRPAPSCLVGHMGELRSVGSVVGYLMHDDQMMVGLDGNLDVIADDAGTAAAGGHRAGIGIGQRDLLVRGGEHLHLEKLETPHLLLQRLDLLFDFRYVADEDVYVCPAGEKLAYSFTTQDKGMVLRRYRTIKNSCTKGKERLIS